MQAARYPLTWPQGWKRTNPNNRLQARFNKKIFGTYTGRRDLTIGDAIGRLLEELRMLDIREGDAIISSNLKTRLDGLPYSEQKESSDPGAAVYWKIYGQQKMKVMAIDLYDRVADNLAAIAATLNAMRAIERHGGAQILERAFTGFDALPSPEDKDFRTILSLKGHITLADAKEAYRRLSFERHPDHGGSQEMMADLNWAWKMAQKELSEHG